MRSDAELAAGLAREAGEILLRARAGNGGTPVEIGKAGDHAANAFLVEALRRERPDDGLLSEEMQCDGARLAKSRVWIIDPVDGTREFGEGRSDWAVHIGLAINGAAAVGAVSLPAQDLVFRSDQPDTLPLLPKRPRIVVSRSRPATEAERVAEALNAEMIPMGSAGAKAMAIVRGEADIYLHTGGQHQWDNCAPAAVASAYGLHVSRADGSPMIYNSSDSLLPDLLICRQEWAQTVLDILN